VIINVLRQSVWSVVIEVTLEWTRGPIRRGYWQVNLTMVPRSVFAAVENNRARASPHVEPSRMSAFKRTELIQMLTRRSQMALQRLTKLKVGTTDDVGLAHGLLQVVTTCTPGGVRRVVRPSPRDDSNRETRLWEPPLKAADAMAEASSAQPFKSIALSGLASRVVATPRPHVFVARQPNQSRPRLWLSGFDRDKDQTGLVPWLCVAFACTGE